MFFRYLDFIFAPFRAINNKFVTARNVKGNVKIDVNRAKSLANRGQQFGGKANQKVQGWGQQQPQQGAQQMQQPGAPGMPPGMPPGGFPGAPPGMPPGMPGMPGAGPPGM